MNQKFVKLFYEIIQTQLIDMKCYFIINCHNNIILVDIIPISLQTFIFKNVL